MSNRAAKIAAPMLRKFDAGGRAVEIATAAEVRVALERCDVHPAVIREWENEAMRRHGGTGSSEIAGHAYRHAIQEAQRRKMEQEDKRAKLIPSDRTLYKPGIARRLAQKLLKKLRWRSRRKVAVASRKRAHKQ